VLAITGTRAKFPAVFLAPKERKLLIGQWLIF